ncbi:MAG: glycosyltransferase family 39 protein [Chloroflexi bacterium]|nr:glycosyltransferase family 39 protein [Chloroflexota bacterium]
MNRWSPPSGRISSAALFPLLGVALALRLWGADWQLPWQFHPDEGHYVQKAADMVRNGNLNPKYFRNPSLFTYILWLEDLAVQQAGPLGDQLGPVKEQLGQLADLLQPPSIYPFLGRLTSALMGAATVVVTAHLGNLLLGRGAALLGALFLATSFLHVRDSHFATNDVPATFFLALSVLAAARLAERNGRKHALMSSIWGGLATSAKYNAGFFIVPLAVAALAASGFRIRPPRAVARPLLAAAGLLLAAGIVALLAYLLGTPYTVLDWKTFWGDFLVQRRFSRLGWEGQSSDPVSWLHLTTLVQGFGPVALVLSVVGAALLTWRRPLSAGVLLGYPLVYLAFMLTVHLFFARFVVPVLPFLALAAAFAVVELARLAPRPVQLPCILALALLTIGPNLWNDVLHNRLLQADDTRTLAYAWLDEHAAPGARLAIDDYSIRDRRPRESLPERGRFNVDIFADPSLGVHDVAWYRQSGFDYLVLSSFQYQRFPGTVGFYQQVDREARLVATFSPARDGSALPFDIEELYSPFNNLQRYARTGPTIKVYALNPGAAGALSGVAPS